MVEMRKIMAILVMFMIISQIPTAYGGRYIVNKYDSEYGFNFREVLSTEETQYFLIEGSRNMEVRMHVSVEGTTLNHAYLSIYLVPGNYTMPNGSVAPDNYDAMHSHTSPTGDFSTVFVMNQYTEYTLVVIPNGSSAYTVEIKGSNETASFGMTSLVCFTMLLAAVALALIYFRVKGVIGPPRTVKFRKMGKKKGEEEGKKDHEEPYRIR